MIQIIMLMSLALTPRERLIEEQQLSPEMSAEFVHLRLIRKVIVEPATPGASGFRPLAKTDGYRLWIDNGFAHTANTHQLFKALAHESRHVEQIRRWPWPIGIILLDWFRYRAEDDARIYAAERAAQVPPPWWVMNDGWLDEER